MRGSYTYVGRRYLDTPNVSKNDILVRTYGLYTPKLAQNYKKSAFSGISSHAIGFEQNSTNQEK